MVLITYSLFALQQRLIWILSFMQQLVQWSAEPESNIDLFTFSQSNYPGGSR